MKIVLLENLGVTESYLEQQKNKLEEMGHQFLSYEKTDDQNLLIERTKDADVIMLANMPLSKEVVEQAPNLKMVDVAFTGVDHIPMERLKERGIVVCNASGYATEAVAELVVGFMIQLFRNTREVEWKCRQEGTKAGFIGSLVQGKTIGIIGAGAIGKRVAFLCKLYGCHIICTNPSKVQYDYIDEQVDLETLLKRSDVVTIHCPLTEQTRHMIGKQELERMKKKAFLINTARGDVIELDALKEALKKGTIAGAAVDVFDIEPPLPKDYPLLQCPHLIMTPHIGYATVESFTQRAEIVFENLYAWLEGNSMRIVEQKVNNPDSKFY